MRVATIEHQGTEQAALVLEDGVLPLATLNEQQKSDWPADMLSLLVSGRFYELKDWFTATGGALKATMENPRFRPLYRRPRKIWGIGLNYVAHAADLAEKAPHEEPASFMKPDTSIIGPGDTICIPQQSDKTTGEAELGVIFGREGKNVTEANWLDVVAGFTTILDMTAEDILRKNPRYLTRCKSFDTFFSFGPVLVTPDEIPDVHRLKVATVINGRVHAENVVANMTFSPPQLVAFHSRVMPWLPGDILSTGTPQAAPLKDGDTLECRIDGFPSLRNPVRDLKINSR
ncbi:MAG TPA: fumarylacetoacetate hydrolase family protein [Verrucomicrobiaceae bacterium]|jgi:2-keto-4-pentenoate hydratase/2-oxohepta-3-ene-1,7-dioic acid hydratase in catechol pathway